MDGRKTHALAHGLAALPAAWVCMQVCLPRSHFRISAYLFCDAHLQLDIKLPFLEKADAMHPRMVIANAEVSTSWHHLIRRSTHTAALHRGEKAWSGLSVTVV